MNRKQREIKRKIAKGHSKREFNYLLGKHVCVHSGALPWVGLAKASKVKLQVVAFDKDGCGDLWLLCHTNSADLETHDGNFDSCVKDITFHHKHKMQGENYWWIQSDSIIGTYK